MSVENLLAEAKELGILAISAHGTLTEGALKDSIRAIKRTYEYEEVNLKKINITKKDIGELSDHESSGN
jgi:hypothetical protein